MPRRRLRQPIKRHGGKSYQAVKEILPLMPPRVREPNDPDPDDPGWLYYVGPFFGAGAVLIAQDPRGISEVVNDIDTELTTFWDVLKSRELFPEFARLAGLTPVSEVEYERALAALGDPGLPPVQRGLAFYVRNRQSRQALERDFATPSDGRTRRGMQEHVSSWLSAVAGLDAMHERLQRVMIYCGDALDFIPEHDHPRTLFYCDPPYVPGTRTVKDAYGTYEMTEDQHRRLLGILAGVRGRFLLSGYHNPLYDGFAREHGWRCHEYRLDNKAAAGPDKRIMTECVWMNYQLG
jgi:DNA adenine methylase